MGWAVEFTSGSRKQKDKLPRRVQELLFQLAREIEASGPVRGDWPNYSKLPNNEHHCHLKKENPPTWRSGEKSKKKSELWRSRMQAVTKKPPTDDMVTVRLHVRRRNVDRIKEYARILESEEDRTYSVAEVFPEYLGKEHQVALRAYRTREDLTQKDLSLMTGIPQHHISEMENGKRTIGKERARKLAQALNVSDYRVFL